MKSILLLILTILVINLSAQSNWGIDLRTSRQATTNSGTITGRDFGFSGKHIVTSETDVISTSYSIGLYYKLKENHLIKLHFGSHENGRKIDLVDFNDSGSYLSYEDVELPYKYYQYTSSYEYRIIKGRLFFPIEVGLSVNKLRNRGDFFYIPVKDYNYDYRISGGIQYEIVNSVTIGLKAIYTSNLNKNYLIHKANGTYRPKQIGAEVSITYDL